MDDPDDDEPTPPTAERVARRALVLAAVAAKATLARDLATREIDAAEADRRHARLIGWFDRLAVEDEAEPDEREWLDAAPKPEASRDAINAMWRVEGLAVLAWALDRAELPRYDEMVDVDEVFAAVALLDPRARELPATAELRSDDELETYARQLLGYHWRMRDFGLRPQRMDFRAFAANCWFGSFDLTPFTLSGDELTLGGKRIDRCDRETVSRCNSIAMERHKAINWLRRGGESYSEVDTST